MNATTSLTLQLNDGHVVPRLGIRTYPLDDLDAERGVMQAAELA